MNPAGMAVKTVGLTSGCLGRVGRCRTERARKAVSAAQKIAEGVASRLAGGKARTTNRSAGQ